MLLCKLTKIPASLLLLTSQVLAASWSFDDATLTVQTKGSGVGAGLKEKLTPSTPLSKAIPFQSLDILKVTLTTVENGTPKKAHQAFLAVRDPHSGLEVAYPLVVKGSGKAKVELTQKDLPAQFLSASRPLKARFMIASFSESQPFKKDLFDIDIKLDTNAPSAAVKKPLRYGKLDEIHHIFRLDAKSPATVITLLFTAVNLLALGSLLVAWLGLGANTDHVAEAMQRAPLAYASFFGSILALEYIFFMYYLKWNLFQTLPVAGMVAAIAYLSGSRALTEVQERRLAGKR